MPLSYKPRRIHAALAALVLATIVCGVAWRNSLREADRLRAMNRSLSARAAALEDEVASRQRESDDVRDATEKVIADLEQQITGLNDARDSLHSELDKISGGFAIPEGIVRWVDPVGKKVWINLGEADGLRPRTTFNVLKGVRTRVAQGRIEFGVGHHDSKGTVEVTRILEEHLAEARILDESIATPIAKGDAIYSQTWHRRRGEAFSLVGIMDLDGDGKSDLDLLRQLIAFAGGRIDNEVDETGALRVNGEISKDGQPVVTESTKFIVIGKIPDVTDDAGPQAVDQIQKILVIRKLLEEAARDQGVRVISLEDFLQYLGFNPKARRANDRRVLQNWKGRS